MTGGLGLKRLGMNIAWTTGRHLAGLLLGLGLAVLLARVLGPGGNGRYAVAVLLPSLLGMLLSLGIGPANVYFVGRGEVELSRALRVTLRSWLTISAGGLLAGSLVVVLRAEAWLPGVPRSVLWIALGAFPPFLLHTLLSSLIQARQRFDWFNRVLLLPPAVTVVAAVVGVWWLDGGVPAAVAAFTVGYAAGALEAYRLVAAESRGDSTQGAAAARPGTLDYLRQCLGYGWKAHASNILAFVNYRIDILLVNLLLTPAATGIYVVAVQIAERMWILSQGVSAVLLPRLAELGGDEEKRRLITPLVARWVIALSLMGGLVLAVVAPWLLPAIFGRDFASALVPLLILIPGIVAGSFSKVLANDFAARGRPELNLYTSGLVVGVNVAANLLLIPWLGIEGAAWATTLAYCANAMAKTILYASVTGQAPRSLFVPGAIDRRVLNALLGWRWGNG